MARHYIEEGIQRSLVCWFDAQHPKLSRLLIGFINGQHVGPRTGQRWKDLGVRAGTPDLLLAVPIKGKPGMWLEMKTQTGRVTPIQKKMHMELALHGWEVRIIRSLEEGICEITSYLRS